MQHFIFLCLLAFLAYGCESVYVTRYLQAQYCPEALVLKGAERIGGKVQAELAPLALDCEVHWSGEMGGASFQVSAVEVEITIYARLAQPSKARLPLRVALIRQEDQQILRRQAFTIDAVQGEWRTKTIRQTLPAELIQSNASSRFVVGLLPLSRTPQARIDSPQQNR